MKGIFSFLLVLCITISFADIIHLKNGLQIECEVLAVDMDSVTVKTATGEIKIAASDIERIETTETIEKVEPEPRKISEGGIPKSIKQVGFGCLGGIIGGSTAGIVAWWTGGFGDSSGKAPTTIVLGSVILGIIIGVAVGGG